MAAMVSTEREQAVAPVSGDAAAPPPAPKKKQRSAAAVATKGTIKKRKRAASEDSDDGEDLKDFIVPDEDIVEASSPKTSALHEDEEILQQLTPEVLSMGIVLENGLRRSARANKGKPPVVYMDADYAKLMLEGEDPEEVFGSEPSSEEEEAEEAYDDDDDEEGCEDDGGPDTEETDEDFDDTENAASSEDDDDEESDETIE